MKMVSAALDGGDSVRGGDTLLSITAPLGQSGVSGGSSHAVIHESTRQKKTPRSRACGGELIIWRMVGRRWK
jgi:hypothetical protein